MIHVKTMRIVGEYTNATISGNGCGGLATGTGDVLINSGGATKTTLYNWAVYKLPVDGYVPGQRNVPCAKKLAEDKGPMRDAHGAAIFTNPAQPGIGRYFWQVDRGRNLIEVLDLATDVWLPEATINMLDANITSDPSGDLMTTSPDQKWAFVALRGTMPLSGDPHVAIGSLVRLRASTLYLSGLRS